MGRRGNCILVNYPTLRWDIPELVKASDWIPECPTLVFTGYLKQLMVAALCMAEGRVFHSPGVIVEKAYFQFSTLQYSIGCSSRNRISPDDLSDHRGLCRGEKVF